MHSPDVSQPNLDTFNEFSNSYAELMLRVMQQNIEQIQLMQAKFAESVRQMLPKETTANPDESTKNLEQEIESLKAQVEELNHRFAALENKTKSGRWNKTGSGHFKIS